MTVRQWLICVFIGSTGIFSSMAMAGDPVNYKDVDFNDVYKTAHSQDLVHNIYVDPTKPFPLDKVDWTGFTISDFATVCEKNRDVGNVTPNKLHDDIFMHILFAKKILTPLINTRPESVSSHFCWIDDGSHYDHNKRIMLNNLGYKSKVKHTIKGTVFSYS